MFLNLKASLGGWYCFLIFESILTWFGTRKWRVVCNRYWNMKFWEWRIGPEEIKMLHFLAKNLVMLVLHLSELIPRHRAKTGSLKLWSSYSIWPQRIINNEGRLFSEGRTNVHVGQFNLQSVCSIYPFYICLFKIVIIYYFFIIEYILLVTNISNYESEYKQILSHES